MTIALELERLIPLSKDMIFKYWVEPRLLELWSAPNGMTLRVPYFHAEKSGKYCFKHTGKEGVYVCDGIVKDIIPNEKLVMVDHVKDPEGNVMFDNLETTVTFNENPDGTRIHMRQKGFQDHQSKNSCEQGWNECLDKLCELLAHIRWRPGQDLREQQTRGY